MGLRLVAAGGTFAALALVGLLAGILWSERSGQSLWVVAGLFGGLLLGGSAALRLLWRELH